MAPVTSVSAQAPVTHPVSEAQKIDEQFQHVVSGPLSKTPINYCLLKGMSNSISGGIGRSVRAVLSAFSNLEIKLKGEEVA